MRRWTSPAIRNINCGMEVTSYESAEIDGDLIGPDGVGRLRLAVPVETTGRARR